MDNKRLIHAVAGSGKTTKIIETIDPQKRNLILTYTETNQNTIRAKLIDKFGYIPESTFIFGVFEFLYGFCLVPYLGKRPKGINFDYQPQGKFDKTAIDTTGRIVQNQLSKSLLRGSLIYKRKEIKFDNSYLDRIDKFFDCIYVDECQDFESDDFDWLLSLSNLNAEVSLLGDFYQKTLSTSRRGNKGKGIHSSFENWIKVISDSGFKIDLSSLSKSYRCPKIVCDFIVENLAIEISSQLEEKYSAPITLIDSQDKIESIMGDDNVMKLFYQKSYDYDCKNQNWGDSKGSEYENVCVVLNQTTYKLFAADRLNELSSQTKSKFYVACTRTRGNLYFVKQSDIEKYRKMM
ncbi:Viral (Superfamily 1) RNA helicase [Streptococcus pneumoniae]|nr:Viral (Superfamily 1) RNA helicase [Streptococcus pneumoniae]VJG59618.1 Viral (Superfamily 1) RNA helicase [Streptococcus pneumoniae]VJL21300.1 Viral (Superfamily 1) RNA helicase [Streptococcus pneumoniae]VJS69232.1 Viral (Superfamily 1) RNA helicase [Streptococcus pneumoniae]VKQ50333.1 Viral (Superfamily 1) RNA helicase [Streptococcus pneumoniae]